MKIISIIPARGGSKSINKKNILDLAGKPLIYYTIEASIKSKKIDKTIISTEDEEIAKVCKKYEEIELINRPIELAGDNISNIDVIFHIFDYLQNEIDNSTIVILLQPTSPLRTAEDIDGAIKVFQQGNYNSLISVCETNHPPQWSLKIEEGNLKALFKKKWLFTIRQDLEKGYMPNGAIFITTKQILEKNKTYYCDKIKPYIMPPERSIDIDTPFDLKIAELLIKNKI